MKVVFAVAGAVLACAPALAAWVPPPDPDPRAILQEARDDAAAGRYADALDKQLWFHNEALKIERGFGGVRLSFALAQWRNLGRDYPPALDALKNVRDQASIEVRTARRPFDAFHDLSSINSVLGEEARTAELFAWLDANRPEVAKQTYSVAQNSLIATRNYALCGKYLSGAAETDRIVAMHRLNRGMASRDERLGEFTRTSFVKGATTLVALLAVNGRKAEADAAMEEFLKELPDDSFRRELQEAAKGNVPEPWPPSI